MDSSLKLQLDVRNNAQDLQNYMLDLNNWEEEMKKKELELNVEKSQQCKIPPPRNKFKQRKAENNKSSSQKPKRISAYDYSAWDKFDVDKACAQIDEEDSQDYNDIINKTSGKDNENNSEGEEEEINTNEREKQLLLIDEAFYEKENGNQFVKKGQWNEAIKCYTNAINLDSKNAVYYANRSLCFLKLKNFKAAEVDATIAIQLDKNYVKAYQRRAFVRVALGQLAEAKADYEEIVKIEPKNALARVEIDKIDAKLKADLEAANPVVKNIFNHKQIFKSEEKKPKFSKTTDVSKIKSTKNFSPEIKNSDIPKEGKGDKNIKNIIDPEVKIEERERNLDISYKPGFDKKSSVFKPLPEWCTPLQPVNIPPHKRSKKVLKRINIVEITSDEAIDGFEEETPILISIETNKGKVVLPKVAKDDFLIRERLSFDVPKTSIQFQNCWKVLKKTPEEALLYLKKIPGNKLPQIFGSSLESDFFSELINFLADQNIKNESDLVYEFLMGLSNVNRFTSLILFMSEKDKDSVRKCISQLDQTKFKEKIPELYGVYEL